jgi:hypothetical protein
MRSAMWILVWLVLGTAWGADLMPRRTASTLAAPMLAPAPAIDGKLDDAAWGKAQPLRDWAYNKDIRYQTEAWVGRDATTLYFAARCFDDNLKGLVTENEGTALWRNDCIELFLVPDKERLFFAHMVISCDGKEIGRAHV